MSTHLAILDLAFDADARAALEKIIVDHVPCWPHFLGEVQNRIVTDTWTQADNDAALILMRAIKGRVAVQDIRLAFMHERTLSNMGIA